MGDAENRRRISDLLGSVIEELDVPPSKYEEARERYDAVGSWLNGKDSHLKQYSPTVFPQGSFALGTAVTPLGDDDYDVDAVCILQLAKRGTTQQQLKALVGDRLKENGTYIEMIDPKEGGRRCWTIQYADSSRFHLDILPAIPDDYAWLIACGIPHVQAQHAVCITDRDTWEHAADWPKSNPQGYTEWFKGRMRVALNEGRMALARRTRASVQDIPDHAVRTPLQRVIQLLKRHRDIHYNGDDDKPISIIITTLAAHAYANEPDLVDAMLNIVSGMRRAIEHRNGVWWVPNPVNPSENFADKWNETPRKQELFFEWLDAIEQEHKTLLGQSELEKVGRCLAEAYGERETSAALNKYASQRGMYPMVVPPRTPPARFNVEYRESPKWPLTLSYRVSLSARAHRAGFRTFSFASGSRAIPKQYWLTFEAKTDVPRPFDVHWQVVNTGQEALLANSLRGNFYEGEGSLGLIRTERTLYTGSHWVECFVIKDNLCVARSGEFVVNIV